MSAIVDHGKESLADLTRELDEQRALREEQLRDMESGRAEIAALQAKLEAQHFRMEMRGSELEAMRVAAEKPAVYAQEAPVALPAHPREVARKAMEFEDLVRPLVELTAHRDLSSLMRSWSSSLQSYASIVKIGFPLGDWRAGGGMESDASGRISMSKDGRDICFTYPESFDKRPVTFSVDCVRGVTLSRADAEAEASTEFNTVSFAIRFSEKRGGGGEEEIVELGPFCPPLAMELQAWVLVLATVSKKRAGGGREAGVNAKHAANARSSARMVLSEVSKSEPSFMDAYERVVGVATRVAEESGVAVEDIASFLQ